MHTEQQLRDIGLLSKGLQLLGIDVALKPSEKLHYAVPCRYINNHDGSLRWLWPASAREPQMLRFYYQGSARSKWIARFIRAGFKLRMPGLVSSGKVVLYTTAIGARQLSQLHDWAIFTGRPGISRKLVIWHEDKNGRSAFTKLSLTIYAAKNIYKERTAIQEATPEAVVMPRLVETRCLAFTQEDIFDKGAGIPLRETSDLPLVTMQRWLGDNVYLKRLSEVSWYQEAQAWLNGPRRSKDDRISEVLLEKMRTLIDCMLPQAKVPVARSHGDFTPWNVRRCGDKLLMIDWEQSRDDMPALYDLFHFIYQNNILVKGRPFAAIRREIDDTLRRPEWEDFLLEHDIDPGEAEQQYLLSSISRYLQEYARQVRWYHKAPAMMQTWCEALGFWMDYEGLLTQRQIVLQDVIHFLHDKPYAALKLCVQDITALPLSSVLELCMPVSTADALLAYLNKHRCVERIRIRRKTFMRQISVFLSGGSSIHLDCIGEMRIGSLVFANAKEIWAAARFNEMGVRQPVLGEDLRYTRLYYLLHGASMPQQHRDHYLGQSIGLQYELLHRLQEEGVSGSKSFAGMLQYDDANYERSVAFLKTLPENRGWNRLWHGIQHIADIMRGLLPKRGFAITFSGVDGAGKHTVIEATKHRITQELRMPVIVLPHRPSFLSVLFPDRAYQGSAFRTVSFRGARPASFAEAILRFIYNYIDYFFAHCYVYLRYVMRGYVVLFDQYFYFINDSKSHNIILPSAFTSWWYRFLLKPDLNFLLYAPASVILERKQELSADDIERLTGQYLALFNKLERRSGHGHYISVRNMRLGDTVETLFQHIKMQAQTAA
jgi:thymidylate kinase